MKKKSFLAMILACSLLFGQTAFAQEVTQIPQEQNYMQVSEEQHSENGEMTEGEDILTDENEDLLSADTAITDDNEAQAAGDSNTEVVEEEQQNDIPYTFEEKSEMEDILEEESLIENYAEASQNAEIDETCIIYMGYPIILGKYIGSTDTNEVELEFSDESICSGSVIEMDSWRDFTLLEASCIIQI